MLLLSPLLAAAAAAHIAAATPAFAPSAVTALDTASGVIAARPASDSTDGSAGAQMRITVDSANSQIVVSTGPFRLPAKPAGMEGMDMHGMHGMEGMEGMEHHTLSHFMRFDWPVQGWLRGFRVDMTDANGKPLSGKVLHHLIGVNLDRRQLVYHAVERLFGWGSETDPVELPSGLAVPLKEGEHLGMYAMFDNETGKDVEAYLRLTIPYVSTADCSLP
jgi:hypothetical protein